jgi:hypothetical protein
MDWFVMSDVSRLIDRVHRPTPREFYQKYVRANHPVVITGITDHWQAIGKWTPEFFRQQHPDAKLVYTAWEGEGLTNDPTKYYRNGKRRTTTLGAFIEAMNSPQQTSRDYVSQFDLQGTAAIER